jgi:hypothetical protein
MIGDGRRQMFCESVCINHSPGEVEVDDEICLEFGGE